MYVYCGCGCMCVALLKRRKKETKQNACWNIIIILIGRIGRSIQQPNIRIIIILIRDVTIIVETILFRQFNSNEMNCWFYATLYNNERKTFKNNHYESIDDENLLFPIFCLKINVKSNATCWTGLSTAAISLANVLVGKQFFIAGQRVRTLVHIWYTQCKTRESFS